MAAALSKSDVVREAVYSTFGTHGFVLQTAKILMTEFCAEPQVVSYADLRILSLIREIDSASTPGEYAWRVP